MPLTLDEYQEKSFTTAVYPQRGTGNPMALAYTALGLNGEAGEVAEVVKKYLRGDRGADELTPEELEALGQEIADVLWYVGGLCTELGLKLGEIAQKNLDKLASRKERGLLKGSGSSR